MKILFNDVIQYSDAPINLKSPALSDKYYISSDDFTFSVKLDKSRQINSIGLGNTDGRYFIIKFNDEKNTAFQIEYEGNGLYVMQNTVIADEITVHSDAGYLGRLGAGIGCSIPTAIAKEPAFASTSEPRITLSGQVTEGRGGYNYRALSLDSRYKITKEIMDEIKEGYGAIGMGYPFFIDLTDESYKLPFKKLYANEKTQRSMTFQSGVRRCLYSKKFDFEERF